MANKANSLNLAQAGSWDDATMPSKSDCGRFAASGLLAAGVSVGHEHIHVVLFHRESQRPARAETALPFAVCAGLGLI